MDEDIAAWPDDRIWAELQTRFALPGWELKEGPILDKAITPMRSFVAAPMRYGRLSWPATPRTSCRPPAPRGSTWR